MRLAHGICTALTLAGCGGDFGGGTPDGGGACTVALEADASSYTIPFDARITAIVTRPGTGAGSYGWSITAPDGSPITDFVESSPVASRIDFHGEAAGAYQVSVSLGYANGNCSDAITVVATEPGATQRNYRMRFTPPGPDDPPPQDSPTTILVVAGVPSLPVATLQLDPGLARSGTVADSGGSPLSAYLRFDRDGAVHSLELPVGASGAWSARLDPAGQYDVLVAPYGDLPALRVRDAAATSLGDFAVTAGELVTGHVREAGGAAVAGARVSVRAGNLPATVATTDAGGAFQARLRVAEGLLVVRVVPPAGSGLAGVELAETAGVIASAGGTVEVTLPATTPRAVAATVQSSTGTPMPGAVVSFRSTSLPGAGNVAVDGVPHGVAGFGSATLVADGAGAIATSLPRGAYQVVVEPPASATSQAVTVQAVDLTAAAPSSFASGTGRTVAVTVVDAAGTPVQQARVTITSRGLADGTAAGASRIAPTNSLGVANVPAVAVGIAHDVTIEPPFPQQTLMARARRPLDETATSLPVALSRAVVLDGRVVGTLGSAGTSGIRVEAICVDCPGGSRVTAETLTAPGGDFLLPVPEPGLE